MLRGGVARASVPIPGEDGDTFSRLIGPWEPFGGPWLSEVGRRNSRVEAAAHCEVLEFGGGALAKALRGLPDLATELVALLEFELLERQELCEVLVPRQTDRRLALLLVLLAGKFGEGPDAEPPLRIGLRLTHWDLAGMVAATRESVTAALRTLRRAGLIVAERQRVVLPDPDALAGYAG